MAPTTPERPMAARIGAVAAALLALSLVPRLVGIDHGLPHRGEPDTYIVVQADRLLEAGLTDRYRAGWKYPHLVATVVAAVPAPAIERPAPGASLEEHRRTATALQLRTRIVAAVISAFAAPATFLVALRFLPMLWAACAGLLVATSLLQLGFSVQARPHGPISAFAALALLSALRWAEKPTLGRAMALGLASACAVGTLHTGFAVLAPALVAFVAALRASRGARGRVLLGALAALALVAASAGWFYVRAADGFGMDSAQTSAAIAERKGGLGDEDLDERAQVGRTTEDLSEGRPLLWVSGHPIPLDLFDGRGFGMAWRTMVRYDPLLLLFGIVGALWALARARSWLRRADVWIVLAFALPTLGLYGLYAKSTDRFLTILVPTAALAAALGLRATAGRVRFAGPALAASAVLACGGAAIQAVRLKARPDTLAEAAAWLESNVEPDETVHLTNLRSLPLFARPENVEEEMTWINGPWEAYQWALLHPENGHVRGERRRPGRLDAAASKRLGRALRYASARDHYRMILADNRVEQARSILAETSPSFAAVELGVVDRRGPVPQSVLAAGWHAPFDRDGWTLVHRVDNGLPGETPAMEYRLGFLGVLRARAFGPDVEIYAAPGT